MRTAQVDVDGTVRVSVAPGFVPVLMRGMLPALRDAHPFLRVDLDGGFQRVDLAQHALVLHIEAMHRVPPRRCMATYRGTARELSRVDDLEIACQTNSGGGGIAVLPCFIADPVPGLRRVFPDRVAVNPGWVVYHEAARDTSRVRVVADVLKEFFRSHEAMFSAAGCRAAVRCQRSGAANHC